MFHLVALHSQDASGIVSDRSTSRKCTTAASSSSTSSPATPMSSLRPGFMAEIMALNTREQQLVRHKTHHWGNSLYIQTGIVRQIQEMGGNLQWRYYGWDQESYL